MKLANTMRDRPGALAAVDAVVTEGEDGETDIKGLLVA
jgi:hypothetical protein